MDATATQAFLATLQDEIERRCFVAAALMMEFNRSGLVNFLRALAIEKPPRAGKNNPIAVNANDLALYLESWIRAGVAHANGSHPLTHRIDPVWGERCLHDPSMRSVLLEFKAKLIVISTPNEAGYAQQYYFNRDECRDRSFVVARCGIYLGETNEIEDLLKIFGSTFLWPKASVADVTKLLPLQASMAAIQTLPELLRALWNSWAVQRATAVFKLPERDMLVALAADLSEQHRDLRLQAGFLMALSGAAPDIGDHFNNPNDCTSLQIQSLIALRKGNWIEARSFARAAHLASAGRTKKKARLEGPAAPLLTLALATGDERDKSIADMQGPAQRNTRLKRMLAIAAGSRTSELTEYFFDGLQETSLLENALALLLSATFWPPYPPSHPAAARFNTHLNAICGDLLHRLKGSDFPWVAEQISAALSGMKSEKTRSLPTSSLLNLWTVQPAWESGLEKLERLLDRSQQVAFVPAASPEKQSRLAFVLLLRIAEGEPLQVSRISIDPRLQKRQGAKWSAGRAVSLQKLFEGTSDAPITPADRKVANTIRVHKSWNDTYCQFSQAALAALVGHPCVMWDDDPTGTPVTVVDGQAELRVKKTDAGFKFEFYPVPETSGFGVLRPEPNRLAVISFTDAQTEAMQVLGTLPLIPLQAHERLGATISRLSGLFHVQSEYEFAGVSAHSKEVIADARPVLLLSRANPGLNVVLCVEPLGPQGPQFIPGQGLANIAAEVDGTRVTCQRNLAAESALCKSLVNIHEILVLPARGNAFCIDDFSKCLELIRCLGAIDSCPNVLVRWTDSEPITVVGEIGNSNLRLELKTTEQWLELSGEATLNEDLILSMTDLIDEGNLKRGYIQLPNGRYVLISSEAGRHMRAMLAISRSVSKNQLTLPPSALGFVGGWLNDLKRLKALKTDAAATKQLRRIEQVFETIPIVPRTLEAELREYQSVGFTFLSRLSAFGAGVILADDMGLGKTLMTLALLLERAEMGPALVVAPLSVKSNWIDEAQRFAPTLRFISFEDAQLTSVAAFDVVICSYNVMTQNIELLEKAVWTTLVLDEAQALKNASTQRAQAACRINAKARICLTGTPIENHLGDLYSLMNIANPRLLGSAKSFEEKFAKPIQRDGDQAMQQVLLSVISPFVLRRKKSEVLKELPSRTELLLEVEPEDAERAFLESLRRKALGALQNKASSRESAIYILAELTRLRRAACHPKLVSPDVNVGAAKLEALVALVHDLRQGQHRALIFSQFVDFLTIVRERLSAEGISSQYLDGSCSEKARKDAVGAFQSGQGDVFLISLKAGGFGLNLTAADYVIHLDPWWNPAVEDQASDRAHRYGQTRPVTIYRLVTVGSVEQKVLALHAKKRDLAENILRGTNTPTALDAAALMGLLAP